jgi:hypothetical protein
LNLSPAELAELDRTAVRVGFFFRLATDPVVRLWLGVGKIAVSDVFEPDGVIYRGFGEIADFPQLRALINGAAERVEFTVSGVTGEVLRVASGADAQQVKGRMVSAGFAVMDKDWQLVGQIKWIRTYTADYLAITQTVPTDPAQSTRRSVTLSCGSLLTARRRPSLSYFSNQDQQSRFPGDRFCERTPVYANGFNKTWPRF